MSVTRCLATIAVAGSLLSAGTALAANPFTVNFAGTATPVTGNMVFDFSLVSGNTYQMDIAINNTTPTPPVGATLTGFGLNLPTSPAISFLTYNPLTSSFRGVLPDGAYLNQNQTYSLVGGADPKLPPFGTYDFCFISKTNPSTCTGAGSGSDGLLQGSSTAVRFTISSNLGSTSSVSNAIKQFIQDNQDGVPGPYGVITRWQGIGPNGGSDKVTGFICTDPNCQPPVPSPGDDVPGPLPLFGAAAAFGYSRKIRRRINLNSSSR